MRSKLQLRFKEWKDRKKYSQKSIDRYFFKPQIFANIRGCSSEKTCYLEEKKIAEEQKQKEMEEKNQKKENVDVKLWQKTKNLNELRRWKKLKGTKKKCSLGSKN